jgi:hypothetical protein
LFGIDAVASAAFSRTCLEKILDDRSIPGYPEARDLKDRIRLFLEEPGLTPATASNVDTLREMGNFVHLNESVATGEIVEISSDEALWALDILGSLFEELYAIPKRETARRDEFKKRPTL